MFVEIEYIKSVSLFCNHDIVESRFFDESIFINRFQYMYFVVIDRAAPSRFAKGVSSKPISKLNQIKIDLSFPFLFFFFLLFFRYLLVLCHSLTYINSKFEPLCFRVPIPTLVNTKEKPLPS